MLSSQEITKVLVCLVCETSHTQLYQVSNCSHRFCLSCSLEYISSQANNFSTARCLQEGCRQPLDKQLPIYSKIDESTTKKLGQFETYQFLQKNNNYRSCKKRDCRGIFQIKQRKCQICQSKHCKKCGELEHKGQCIETREDIQMKKLGYRSCPSCRIWVQKSAGCQFISCKCGAQFCYICGNPFATDPCRMIKKWIAQTELRKLMSQVISKCPSSPTQLCLLPLKILLCVLLTIIICPVVMALLISTQIIVCTIFSICAPLHFMTQEVPKIESECCRCLSTFLFIIGYPMIVAFFELLTLVYVVLYPFFRRGYHHGIYDPLDSLMNKAAKNYLQVVKCILNQQ